MNFPKLFKFRHWTVFVAGVSALALFGCDETKVTQGGSGDETSTVAFFKPDGKPAAGARVSLYGSADTGVEPRKQVVTDADGHARLAAPAKGFYNLVVRDGNGNAVLQDSLFSDGSSISAASDTLHATGVLTGRLAVQSQHSPRIAWIQLLGAGIWSNVDDSGRFRIKGVPAGKLTLAALTRVDGYTPTFANVKTMSDSTVDVGTIELVYTGLPVVKNLQARFDTLAGIVSLKWDSTELRQTWHYNVYRDERLLGQTTGTRWIDTVSDEYPGNVPSQGLHTYRTVLANADSVGPRWESITMRIISAYLYQEVKIDWEKRSELPWPSGLFRIDTAEGRLVGWRSAEYGTSVNLIGENDRRTNAHIGWMEMWVSTDSGKTWFKKEDSLFLGALPVRHAGTWWSVRRGRSSLVPPPGDQGHYGGGLASILYDTGVIVTSTDGRKWDSAAIVAPNSPQTNWRLEESDGHLFLLGGCLTSRCDSVSPSFQGYGYDSHAWRLDGSFWTAILAIDTAVPVQSSGVFMMKSIWSGRWWNILGAAWPILNGHQLPSENSSSYELAYQSLQNIFFPFEASGRVLFFGREKATSMDTAFSVFHSLAWPGKGPHYEMKLGSRILSVSDSGVYLGRILSGTEGGDPRGTWVKQTEIPAVY
jgi:hypothetical protein